MIQMVQMIQMIDILQGEEMMETFKDDWKWLEIAANGLNCWKLLERAGNGFSI